MCEVEGPFCFYVFLLHVLPLHNTRTKTRRKPTGQFSWKKKSVFTLRKGPPFPPQWQEPVRRDWRKETLELQPSQRGDEWRGSLANAQAQAHTCKPSSASLSSPLYPPDEWIEIPSKLHAVAVLMRHVRYGQGTSPSCTRKGKQGKHHRGTTHGSLAHRIAKGMHTGQSGPIGPISKGL